MEISALYDGNPVITGLIKFVYRQWSSFTANISFSGETVFAESDDPHNDSLIVAERGEFVKWDEGYNAKSCSCDK